LALLDFYATAEDQRDLVRFLFAETDVVLYEAYSEFDREVRSFRSLVELEKAFTLGSYQGPRFQLWSPAVMSNPVLRRFELTGVPGHSFRYSVEGAGLIQLYLDGTNDGVLHHTHYSHWNEAGARGRSFHSSDDCDWIALKKLSGRIQRHVRRKLGVGKLYARPILRNAFAALQTGMALQFDGKFHDANSTAITSVAVPQLGRAE
jgi:hypothetical protein